jgi:hypothetical protein
VTLEGAPLRQTAWLFTRADESVHIEIRAKDGGLRLVIAGPGHKSSTRDFPEISALEQYRDGLERDLIQNGFRLMAMTERRGSPSDDEERRSGTERRRGRD